MGLISNGPAHAYQSRSKQSCYNSQVYGIGNARYNGTPHGENTNSAVDNYGSQYPCYYAD